VNNAEQQNRNGPEQSPRHSDGSEPTDSADMTCGSTALSTYSRARFLAAVRGSLPVAQYVQEVVAHVEQQLPHQDIPSDA
jgi:hypothetical protein